MKRMLLALCLMFSASCAHAYGVTIAQPILIGPLASVVYTEFLRLLGESGAVPCGVSFSSSCTRAHVAIITGKRGRSRYIVGTYTFVNYNTDTGQLRFTETGVVRHSASLKRNKGRAWFTAREWGIDRLEERGR